ncbi:MAG: NAD(P)-dependent oxidoreductase [Candidatus Solibacter sp.]|nr:NAD(P)-dependent oxidoreductase [Candidatus Solibacter sp.]
MARNLLPQALADSDKGRFCATPKEVAENADVIFLCVGDTAMATDVILGADGIIEGVRSGSVVVDCSTIAVSQSRHIGHSLKAKGVDFLDAPITGSTPGAENGNLTFMIGGDLAVVDQIRPLLDPMGKRVYFCGGAGMGLQAKLTQNLILSNILMAFNEGMVLATKGGVGG